MKGQSFIILAIIFMILVAIFAVSNVNPVEVTYFFWKVDSPLILVILFSVLMGGIITAASGMVKIFKLQRQIKSLKNENKKLNQLVDENQNQETITNDDQLDENDKSDESIAPE